MFVSLSRQITIFFPIEIIAAAPKPSHVFDKFVNHHQTSTRHSSAGSNCTALNAGVTHPKSMMTYTVTQKIIVLELNHNSILRGRDSSANAQNDIATQPPAPA
jgi:hypothetical protein